VGDSRSSDDEGIVRGVSSSGSDASQGRTSKLIRSTFLPLSRPDAVRWNEAASVFPRIVPLVSEPVFKRSLLEGLTLSIGSRSEGTVRPSSFPFLFSLRPSLTLSNLIDSLRLEQLPKLSLPTSPLSLLRRYRQPNPPSSPSLALWSKSLPPTSLSTESSSPYSILSFCCLRMEIYLGCRNRHQGRQRELHRFCSRLPRLSLNLAPSSFRSVFEQSFPSRVGTSLECGICRGSLRR